LKPPALQFTDDEMKVLEFIGTMSGVYSAELGNISPPDLDKGLRIALKLNKAGWIMKDGVNKWVRTSNGIDAFYEQTQLMAKASMDKDNSLTRQADT
jgi:hypothetical protein